MDNKNKTIKTKGYMKFVLSKEEDGLSFDSYLLEGEKYERTIEEYYFIEGKDFAENVEQGGLIDYDGYISEIIVDGYLSNLGLFTDSLVSGEFLVNMKLFKQLCDEYEVIVNWVNR